jgi:phosphate transport system permease protein
MDPIPAKDAPPKRPVARARETRRSVIVADRVADWTIRIGGLGVILAVLAIMVFLVAVVVPLFGGGTLKGRSEMTLATGARAPLAVAVDEYRTLIVALTEEGEVVAQHLATGHRIKSTRLDLGPEPPTAVGRTIRRDDIALGFADGTLRLGVLRAVVMVIKPEQLPKDLTRLANGDATDGEAVYAPLPGNQFRRVAFEARFEEAQSIVDGAAIRAIDFHKGGTAERPSFVFVTADEKGVIRLSRGEGSVNMLTQQMQMTVETAALPSLPAGARVARLVSTESGDQVYVADESGIVYRFDTRDMKAPALAETADLLPGDAKLTAFGFLLGHQSLVVGGSDGSVQVYFRLARKDARGKDGFALVRAHDLGRQGAAITGFAPSLRTKLFVTADAGGDVLVRHSTSERVLLHLTKAGPAGTYRDVILAPRDDGVIAVDAAGKATYWTIDIPHPETTFHTIFGKVWYEGYDAPGYTWQSSAGTDSFEPKLSLVPLIFGTLKATFYALLFAVPIALLAAIFTSEFCHPTVRAAVKPAMEMMASLPSVVLGFIAALILAPIVETWIAAVVLSFFLVPMGFVVGAYLWQLLPTAWRLKHDGLSKFGLMFVALGGALWLAVTLSAPFERLVFGGSLKAWTSGAGGSFAFMALVLFPATMLATVLLVARFLGRWLVERTRSLAGRAASLFEIGRWAATLGAAIALALVLSALLGGAGYDPRGGFVGTYVQRNTLVVGFAMGFAVIPIIYTIAEDALNAVPEHLRAAALGCGATRWQTATRVILPTAVSGVFAAVMIGMGRAVGETMIVVMAAGNTPILEWNIFNGLRALSANIAVELPEAPKDSTLYRMLFLAALALFVMTFVINTLAEAIRLRYRRRAVQL